MKLPLSLLLLGACFISCTKEAQKEDDNPGCEPVSTLKVTLNNCEQNKTTEAATPPLCFVKLQDSRCGGSPINCVWEGVAICHFTFTVNATEHQLVLGTNKRPGLPPTDTTVAGYHIKLLDVSSGTTPATATVQITK